MMFSIKDREFNVYCVYLKLQKFDYPASGAYLCLLLVLVSSLLSKHVLIINYVFYKGKHSILCYTLITCLLWLMAFSNHHHLRIVLTDRCAAP